MTILLCAILCPVFLVLGVISIPGHPQFWYEKAFPAVMMWLGFGCGVYVAYSVIKLAANWIF